MNPALELRDVARRSDNGTAAVAADSPPPAVDGLAAETRGLGKTFGSRAALHNVDLKVPRGCAFGFLGPNGAGKTTLIRLLLGLAEPTAGRMRLLGRPLAESSRSGTSPRNEACCTPPSRWRSTTLPSPTVTTAGVVTTRPASGRWPSTPTACTTSNALHAAASATSPAASSGSAASGTATVTSTVTSRSPTLTPLSSALRSSPPPRPSGGPGSALNIQYVGYPFHCQDRRLASCHLVACTTRGRTPNCGRGSRTTRRAWTT